MEHGINRLSSRKFNKFIKKDETKNKKININNLLYFYLKQKNLQ